MQGKQYSKLLLAYLQMYWRFLRSCVSCRESADGFLLFFWLYVCLRRRLCKHHAPSNHASSNHASSNYASGLRNTNLNRSSFRMWRLYRNHVSRFHRR